MEKMLKIQIVWLLLFTAGCTTHVIHAEFSDDDIGNYISVFGQSPPDNVTILHSHVDKYVSAYTFIPPREPSSGEWEKVYPDTWSFEMKAPAHYVESIKNTFELELASDRQEIFKQFQGPSWYPRKATDYVIYTHIIWSSTTPYWEMLIFPETEKNAIVHFYLRRY